MLSESPEDVFGEHEGRVAVHASGGESGALRVAVADRRRGVRERLELPLARPERGVKRRPDRFRLRRRDLVRMEAARALYACSPPAAEGTPASSGLGTSALAGDRLSREDAALCSRRRARQASSARLRSADIPSAGSRARVARPASAPPDRLRGGPACTRAASTSAAPVRDVTAGASVASLPARAGADKEAGGRARR